MASTTKVPLGGATLNRKYYCDVNSGTYAAPTWVGIFGVTEFKAGKEPTLNDDSDFDAGGWHSKNITALAWSLEMKVERKVTRATRPSTIRGKSCYERPLMAWARATLLMCVGMRSPPPAPKSRPTAGSPASPGPRKVEICQPTISCRSHWTDVAHARRSHIPTSHLLFLVCIASPRLQTLRLAALWSPSLAWTSSPQARTT